MGLWFWELTSNWEKSLQDTWIFDSTVVRNIGIAHFMASNWKSFHLPPVNILQGIFSRKAISFPGIPLGADSQKCRFGLIKLCFGEAKYSMNYGPDAIYQINEMPSLILIKDKYKITTPSFQQILKHISREKKRFLLYTFPPNVSLTKKKTFVTDVMRCCFYFSNLKPYSGSNTRDNRELKSTFHDFLHFQRYFVTLFLGRFRNGSGWEHIYHSPHFIYIPRFYKWRNS